ncbi:MAG: polyisoprenoid-binding protein [Candidatus Latescibacteria bacterium]|nr:polyisoprenoid-binding protein [Candidatus Latescibacterota bacterium]
MVMAVIFVVLGIGLAHATEYTIDPTHSTVMFKVKHLGISTVTGRFDRFSGTFGFDQKKGTASKAAATIEVASIKTDMNDRDAHLRSADFFNAEQFPTMTFVSKAITNVTPKGFNLTGDLTIHGITRPVVLNVELGGAVKDPWGNERAAFTASTTINRKDFGLTWNKVLETGGLLVGEDVHIMLELEGVAQKK